MWTEIIQALLSLTSALPNLFRGLKVRRRTEFAKALARLHRSLLQVISSGERILDALDQQKSNRVVGALLKDQLVRLSDLTEMLNQPIIKDKLPVFLPDTVRLLRIYTCEKGSLVLRAEYELRRRDDLDSSPPIARWPLARLKSNKILYLDEAQENLSWLIELTEQIRTFLVDKFSMDDLLGVLDNEGST